MTSDNIEKLYENYGILADAKEDISKHEKEYLEIIAAIKGSDKEKRLASQFIAKFFKHFPNLHDEAIEAQFDLCEDEDVTIRKQAIKDLPSICKDNKEHTQRIADILGQLLQSDDSTEITIVTNSFITILKNDILGGLMGLFSQIHQAGDPETGNEIVRQRCIKFLATKVKQLGREVIIKEAEDYIIAECKKILQDVVADEFSYIMDLLTWSTLGKTPGGRKELMEIIATIAFTPEEWHPEDPECIDRLTQCTLQTLPLFSSQVESTIFVKFFCNHILPRWNEITSVDTKVELLKMFAELMEFCGKIDKEDERMTTLYNLLMEYLPEAPVEIIETDSKEEGDQKKPEEKPTPSLEFSNVECALYALHTLCALYPEALAADANRLKALRLRLQYTARLTQGYIKKLKEITHVKKADSDENKLKIAALKTTSNINALIRDIFRTPPSFKTKVQLSFQTKKSPVKDKEEVVTEKKSPEVEKSGHKRHKPITFDNGDSKPSEKRIRDGDNLKVYTPPSGKYSSKLSNNRFSGSGSTKPRGGYGRRDFRNNGGPYRKRNY